MKPRFLIHVGYHKTGTTWLQRQVFSDEMSHFRLIPRHLIDEALIAPNPFEFHDSRAEDLIHQEMEISLESGRVPVLSHESLSGDPLRGGLRAKDLADNVFRAFSDARILIVIREQRSLLLSIYKEYLRRTGVLPVKRLFRPRTIAETRIGGERPRLDYFAFHHFIEYYQQLFGTERVLVLPYELLQSDPMRFMREIAEFMDLPPPPRIPSTRENVAIPGTILAIKRYWNIGLRAIGLDRILAGPLDDSKIRRVHFQLWNDIARLGSSLPSAWVERRWRDQLEPIVAGRYGASNALTSRLIGIDLRLYGYESVEPDG